MRLVTFNITSLDGRIAVSGSTPSMLDPRWKPLEGFEPVDVMTLHQTRLLLEGSNSFTARTAGPADFGDYARQEVPAGDFLPSSVRSHQGRWMVVADSRARVRWNTFEMDGTKLAVLLAAATPAPYRAFLRDHEVPYFEAGPEGVDLPAALARLAAVFAASSIVSNAGGVLNGVLLRAGLVDEAAYSSFRRSWGTRGHPPSSRGSAWAHPAFPPRLSSSRRKHVPTARSSPATPSCERPHPPDHG